MIFPSIPVLLFRFLHIASMTVVMGAAIFGTHALRERRWVSWAAVGLLLSGIYNLLQKTNVPPGYHMWFGVKMLFALHVLTVAFLINRKSIDEAKIRRLERSILWTGSVVLLLSAYLRYLSTWMLT